MRYLEQCVSNLKTANSRRDSPSSATSELPPPPAQRLRCDDDDEASDQDEEMEDAVSPTYVEPPPTKSRYTFAQASPVRQKRIHSLHHHIPSHPAPRSHQRERAVLGEPLSRVTSVRPTPLLAWTMFHSNESFDPPESCFQRPHPICNTLQQPVP